MPVQIPLIKASFGEKEREIASFGSFGISSFRYASGVEALRVRSDRAELIILPFKGQQIWRAVFDGRDITMGSMFPEPRATDVYLETYGAFLLHCGMSAMGVPSEGDNHPLHGEMPNAAMDSAYLRIDEAGQTVTVGGCFQYTVAFTTNYLATPEVTLKAGESKIDVSLTVENLRRTPIDLMYLAHANFKPVDHGELIYLANYNAANVRVRQSIPSHISPPASYAKFIAELAKDPIPHHRFDPSLAFDPEIVFQIDALTDRDGYFHAMHRHPEGFADFISYRPEQAPVTQRWICRTPDQQGLGIAFPATAGVEGKRIESANGRVISLAGSDIWRIDMVMGTLNASEASAMATGIDQAAGRWGHRATTIKPAATKP